jgi:hypothetical protein
MRQGGFKPKSHSSGTYWVRADAKTGGKGKHGKDIEGDIDGDGVVDIWDERTTIAKTIGAIVGIGFAILITIVALLRG